MSLKKKVLLTLGIAGAAAVASGSTFATFTAQTNNPGNVFSTGTLVMSNKVNTGTACLSTGGGSITTNVNDCDTLFNLTVKKPGDSATVNLTIKNEGTVDASALKSFATAACANADAGAESYHGSGNPCSAVQFYIQQTDSAFTATTACLYGGAAVANTCDFSDTAKTLADYSSTYTSSSNGLSIGTLTAGSSKYFTIGVKLPSTADNTYQGREATVGISWYMQ